MAWRVDCGNPECGRPTYPANIVEIVRSCNDDRIIVCENCHRPTGYIRKKFNLQEEGETWEPILRGIVKLGQLNDTYQPFVFLASYEEDQQDGEPPKSISELPITDLWFSYYKDLRGRLLKDGNLGKLKMGYGPGGPPVIDVPQLLELLRHLLRLDIANEPQILALLARSE